MKHHFSGEMVKQEKAEHHVEKGKIYSNYILERIF